MESFFFLLGCYASEPITGAAAWQMAAAAVTGFIAKENVVGTLDVCFVGLENLIDIEVLALMEGAGAACCAGDCRVYRQPAPAAVPPAAEAVRIIRPDRE